MKISIGGWVINAAKAATHVNQQYSPGRTFKTAILVMFTVAGAAMTAMFLYHGVAHAEKQAEYIAFGSGLAALAGGGGLGAWLHSKSGEDTP